MTSGERTGVGSRSQGARRTSRRCGVLLIGALVLALAPACSPPEHNEELIASFPLDSVDDIITKSGVELDPDVTADGHGSIKVTATQPVTIHIAELDMPSIENARLIFRAKLRSQDLKGKAYLEMWVRFPGDVEYFSRAVESALEGTNDWVTQETVFFLQQAQIPNHVRLNLVVDGVGTVWIDEATLSSAPL